MEAFIIDPAKLIGDIVGYISELRNSYQSSQLPVTDDETILHKFCVKLETVLRHEQKEKYSLLGVRKDYWNFISDCIPKDDGVRVVHAIPQVRTPQGKGRAFIRYSLVKKSLADAIQRCLVMKKQLSAYYSPGAILCHPSLSTALVNKLYDLNDLDFDLPCGGHELDISWPAFSRRSFMDNQGSVSGRRSSVSSMTSVDLRNERPDPLIGLASEVSALKATFVEENSLGKTELQLPDGGLDNVSMTDSTAETPTITDMTLEISHLHQRILKWKADMESQVSKASNEVKKAQDDRKFASQDYELKIKQLNERYGNLMKGVSEEMNAKVKELFVKLTTAEKALNQREVEIENLREEVKMSVSSSHEAQRSAIELEKLITTSERKQSELTSECEQLKERLKRKDDMTVELENKLSELKEKCNKLELSEAESKKNVAELQGELKAKEVVLERVQESFEKLNGMVFGSFEELEGELKGRLMDRERGLQNQSAENRRLETNMVEIQQQNRDLTNKLAEANAKIKELENASIESQNVIQDLKTQLHSQEQIQETFLSELNETLQSQEGVDVQDGHYVAKDLSKVILKRAKHLVEEMSSLHDQLNEKSTQTEQLEEHVAELKGNIEKKKIEIISLNEEVDSSRRRIEFINGEKDILEKEKMEADDKLAELEKSEQSLKSDISLVVEEKCQALNELTTLKGLQDEEQKLISNAHDELAALKEQLEETVESKQRLETDLASITDTLTKIDAEKRDLDGQVKTLEEKMSNCQDERIGLEHELDVARQQLEAANEARIRAEQGQVKAQEQLESLRCMMDQEIAALKFQLSSETMKYETELKSLSDQIQEYNSVKERLSEQQELIADLEARLKERNDTLQHDKHKYVSEIKHLRNEVQQYKAGFDENKLKLRALENELLLTSKQLEEERSRQRDLKKKVDEAEEEKGLTNQQYEAKIAQVQEDMEELKNRLVEVTREKAELWQKADDMEHEIKVKADDRWMDDSEVSHCLGCKTEFSFLLRKHHCRICGRIFCNNCSNNWLQTPHSRKLRRVCSTCLNADKRLKAQLVGGPPEIEEDTKSDISEIQSQRTGSVLSGREESDTGGLDAADAHIDSQPVASTSSADALDFPQSTSTPKKPDRKGTKEMERSQSVTSDENHKYTTLKSAKKAEAKAAAKKPIEQPVARDSSVEDDDDEGYEIVDDGDEEACEQPEAQVVVSETDNREDLAIPVVNEEPGQFWHVTVPPGKRHLIQVLVGTTRATLSWKFTTEKKSIRFGVAFKLSEMKKDNECETVVPLSQYSSQLHSIKGEIKDVSPGIYLLVFDNTFSRFTSKRLFCMVQVSRKDDDEGDSES